MSLDDELLAHELQIKALEALSTATDPNGKRKADEFADDELAFQDYKRQLNAAKHQMEDARVADRLASALDMDALILLQHAQEEAQAAADHQLARDFGDETDATNLAAASPTVPSDHASLTGPSGNPNSGRSNSSHPATSGIEAACVCCGDERSALELVKLPCVHVYCLFCVKELFLRATKDESLFPPRCCRQVVPLDRVAEQLSDDELRQFETATIEFSTPDRTYCANTDCGTFILPDNIYADDAKCQQCKQLTCATCKRSGHDGDCPEDVNIQATLALATDQDWRRCYNCHRMVELSLGCNHITLVCCICRAEWCYLCGVQWKQCLCEQFTERYLLATAEHIVDRDAIGAVDPVDRQHRVRAVQRELRDRHNCTHSRHFERVDVESRRGSTCDICGSRAHRFRLRCRFCHVEVCVECRRNRM